MYMAYVMLVILFDIGYHFSSRWSTRSVYRSTSASVKPLCHIWLKCHLHSATHGGLAVKQIILALEEVSLCLVCCLLPLTAVMYHWHWLSSAHNWRLFCFPEPTGHHHSTSGTVLAVKFVCTNTNLLTYWCYDFLWLCSLFFFFSYVWH